MLKQFDALAQMQDVALKAPYVCKDVDDQKFIDLAVAHRAVLGISHQAVSIWRVRGVPYKHRPLLATIADGLGIKVPDGFLSPTVDQKTPARPASEQGASS